MSFFNCFSKIIDLNFMQSINYNKSNESMNSQWWPRIFERLSTLIQFSMVLELELGKA